MGKIIEAKNVIKEYGSFKNPFQALKGINLDIEEGEFLAIMGPSGSGKTTLLNLLATIDQATRGKIYIDGVDITEKNVKLVDIRKKVGLVFQYSEYQLFEETIEKDIEFGPKNLGLSDEEIHQRVVKAMEMVGLDYNEYKDKSPFDLSGGQKRRVAIAGVIAMNPKTLILDEPTAGLDPKGRDDILTQIKKLHDNYGMTIILVSHSMEDVANIADKVIVMNNGSVELQGPIDTVFKEVEKLESIGLAVPQVTYLMLKLKSLGFDVSDGIYTIKQAKEEIIKLLNKNN